MAFKNDMTWMYVMHDALRRELECIARVTARPDDDPKQVLRTAAGWEMFKSYLRIHHTAEDDMLWPPMRQARTARSVRGWSPSGRKTGKASPAGTTRRCRASAC